MRTPTLKIPRKCILLYNTGFEVILIGLGLELGLGLGLLYSTGLEVIPIVQHS